MIRAVFALLVALFPLTLTAAPDSAAALPRKRALLVGISRYYQHGPRPWPNLHARPDVEQLRQVLVEHFGFAEQDILLVTDKQATAQGIREAFSKHLIEQASPGDVVLFHFSGHGQQLADDNGDELDGLDESLVPYDAADSSAAAGARTNIRDDELGHWLAALQARMRGGGRLQGSITVTLDSCFSGTATRAPRKKRGRGWDLQLDGPRPAASRKDEFDGESGWLPNGEAERLGYVLLAAAQNDQPAWESDEMGVFSRALVKALAAERPGMKTTYRMLLDRIAVEMAGVDRDQVPQVEGAVDLELFSGGTVAAGRPQSAVLTKRGPNGSLMLQAGEVHGVTVGSLYALHRLDASALDDTTQLALAEVAEVLPFQSRLMCLQCGHKTDTLAAVKGALAVEKEHRYGDAPLRLYLSGLSRRPDLVARLRRLAVVTVRRGTDRSHDLAATYATRQNRLELKRRGSTAPFKYIPLTASAGEELERILKNEWTWRYLSRLRRENLDARVQMRIVPVKKIRNGVGATQAFQDPTANRSIDSGLSPGDRFKLEFQNQSNRRLYVTVLELGQDGSIGVLYPPPGDGYDNSVAASQPDIPYRQTSYVWEVAGQPGNRALLKVIATDQPVPFASVLSEEAPTHAGQARTGVNQSYQPLALLLARLATGRRARDPSANRIGTAHWSTFDTWLRIIPRSKR